ncbi:hypothetical protein ABIB95_008351 [Bradyrhizobium sp. LA2.1]
MPARCTGTRRCRRIPRHKLLTGSELAMRARFNHGDTVLGHYARPDFWRSVSSTRLLIDTLFAANARERVFAAAISPARAPEKALGSNTSLSQSPRLYRGSTRIVASAYQPATWKGASIFSSIVALHAAWLGRTKLPGAGRDRCRCPVRGTPPPDSTEPLSMVICASDSPSARWIAARSLVRTRHHAGASGGAQASTKSLEDAQTITVLPPSPGSIVPPEYIIDFSWQ